MWGHYRWPLNCIQSMAQTLLVISSVEASWCNVVYPKSSAEVKKAPALSGNEVKDWMLPKIQLSFLQVAHVTVFLSLILISWVDLAAFFVVTCFFFFIHFTKPDLIKTMLNCSSTMHFFLFLLFQANVEGDNCDRCKPDTFGLSVRNPLGCSNCYCYGLTRSCTEAQGLIRMWVSTHICIFCTSFLSPLLLLYNK